MRLSPAERSSAPASAPRSAPSLRASAAPSASWLGDPLATPPAHGASQSLASPLELDAHRPAAHGPAAPLQHHAFPVTGTLEASARQDASLQQRPTLAPHAAFPLTDAGNGERFAEQHATQFRFVSGWGWLTWDGTRWRRDTQQRHLQAAKHTARSILREAAAEEDDERRKRVRAHARHSESHARLKAMLACAQSEPALVASAQDFDADPMLFNVANGTLDLRTGAVRPHEPADLLTKRSPVAYDPAAHSDVWERFLNEITCGDAALRAYLQRAAGYSLTGLTREECFFLCVGSGRNGKTKFLEALKWVLGEYALAIRPEALAARDGSGGVPNDIADLAGARFVISSEFAQGGRLDIARLKSLTGGDTVRARFLYQDHFEFTPQLKLWLATNHLPRIGERQPAIWQRVKVVPFNATFPPERQDKQLDEKLRAAAPAILAWAVAGCQQWLREGLGEPPSVTSATAAYRADDDTLAAFLAECCRSAAGLQVRAQALREAYNAWLVDNQEPSVSDRTFAQLMREQGYEAKRDSKGKRYDGLALHKGGPQDVVLMMHSEKR